MAIPSKSHVERGGHTEEEQEILRLRLEDTPPLRMTGTSMSLRISTAISARS